MSNYDYPVQQLEDMLPDIRALAEKVGMLQVIFNNNQEDQGQRNALALMSLLGQSARFWPALSTAPGVPR